MGVGKHIHILQPERLLAYGLLFACCLIGRWLSSLSVRSFVCRTAKILTASKVKTLAQRHDIVVAVAQYRGGTLQRHGMIVPVGCIPKAYNKSFSYGSYTNSEPTMELHWTYGEPSRSDLPTQSVL